MSRLNLRCISALARTVALSAALVCAGVPAFADTTVIRVNAGGPAYTDSAGHVWSADTGFNTGSAFGNNAPISGTSDPTLYATGRYDASSEAPTLQYSFTVPNGWYEVDLHFAELLFSAGGRKFSVQIEGISAFIDLDVGEAAGVNTALIKTVATQVTDGQLNVELLFGSANNPFINAIEIHTLSGPSKPANLIVGVASGTQLDLNWTASIDDVAVAGYRVERCQGVGCFSFAEIATTVTPNYVDSGLAALTNYRYRIRAFDADGNLSSYSDVAAAKTTVIAFSTLRINAGGAAFTDSLGNAWSADTGFNAGQPFSNSLPISGTNDPILYTSGRYDGPAPPTLQYEFGVPNGEYQVRLHFAEPTLGVGARKFNVQIEGAMVYSNLDVSAEAGVDSALIKTANAVVADGQLNLLLLHGPIENPFINGIEVIQTAALDSQAPTAPVGLAALSISSARVDLSWSPSSDNVEVAGYRLERCAGVGCANFLEVATVAGTAISQTNLSPGTVYRYRLRATDAEANYSAHSSPVSVTTFGGADSQAPSIPANLVVTGVAHNEIALSWSPSTDNLAVSGYRIERCSGVACTAFVQVATSIGTSYGDSGLGAGLVYRYRVRAADAVPNLSDYSAIASATTLLSGGDAQAPSAPGSPNASAYSANRIDLNWIASTDNVAVTRYLVERCTGASCSSFVQIASLTPAASYNDTGLTGGTIYRYRIRARDADGNVGLFSAIAATTTMAGSGTVGSAIYQYDSSGRLKQVTVSPN
jgi:chitodextrinase